VRTARYEARTKQAERRLKTRNAILNAASEIFHRNGVANATVSEISERAGIGHGTFYYYFGGVQDVISAVAERTMEQVVQRSNALLLGEDFIELAPAVSLRMVMRLMSSDPTVHWLLERPHVFVEEWRKVIEPSITEVRRKGEGMEVFTAVGGVDNWIRILPWIIVSELTDAIANGSPDQHGDNLANMTLRLFGLDDERRTFIVETSARLVNEAEPSTAPQINGNTPSPDNE
jgi:AcrR family transcriptional regulator